MFKERSGSGKGAGAKDCIAVCGVVVYTGVV